MPWAMFRRALRGSARSRGPDSGIHLDSDEAHAELGARDRRRAKTQKGISDGSNAIEAVQPEAHLRKPRRKGGGMRSILLSVLDRLVRDEPGIPAAPKPRGRAPPASDVRRILIAHAHGPAIDRGLASRREVEDELVAVVQKARAVDRFVVADREVLIESRVRTRHRFFDRDRLDPVDGVLQPQIGPRRLGNIESGPRIGRFRADVQKQRAVGRQNTCGTANPLGRPLQIFGTRNRVVVAAILNAQIVRRRRDDDVNGSRGQPAEDLDAVVQVEVVACAARFQ